MSLTLACLGVVIESETGQALLLGDSLAFEAPPNVQAGLLRFRTVVRFLEALIYVYWVTM